MGPMDSMNLGNREGGSSEEFFRRIGDIFGND